jgi:hypothetical protein
MTITHQIKSSPNPLPQTGDILSQLSGLIGQATALSNAGVGLPGLQNIGSQIAGLSGAITAAGGTTDLANSIASVGTQMASGTMSQMSGLVSSLSGQLTTLTGQLNPSGLLSSVLHSHVLDKLMGIVHSAFQGQHTVQLTSGGININSATQVAHTAPKLPHNGLTLVSDALQVSLGVTAQGFGMLSDRRLKSNIDDLAPVLAKVLALKVKTFDVKAINWDTGELLGDEAKPSLGLIAQDAQEVLPEVVRDGKYLSIEHDKVTFVLLAAFQEFASETRREIADLKAQIEDLRRS